MSTEAFITPNLITWALNRQGLTTEDLAKRLGLSVETLRAWEHNNGRPSLKQAENLARKLNIPFGYLFLSNPPTENLSLPDLRTVTGAPPRKPSPELLDVLDDALRKQQWYHEHLESEGADPVDFIARFEPNEAVIKIAEDIRNTLRIDDDLREQAGNWEQFLTRFIRKAEELGVLVLRSSIVGSNTHRALNVDEFRGFVISDPLAPLIFINSRDAKTAQIFTLAHELAHLWIGQSGVSNPDYAKRSEDQNNEIERHCNSIAAEALVPSNDFVARWNNHISIDNNIDSLVRHYRVSAFVILRRALDHDKVEHNTYLSKLKELSATHKAPSSDGGGNFYTNVVTRNSPTFTSTLITATAEGRVPYREAASLLSIVHLTTLQKVEAHLLQSGVGSV